MNDRFVIDEFLRSKKPFVYRSEENSVYNDIPLIYEEKHYESLIKGGIDKSMSKHIAHLFIRDPVSLFSEKINQDNNKDSDHFEVCSISNCNFFNSAL